jgi:predicted transcriptional regulator
MFRGLNIDQIPKSKDIDMPAERVIDAKILILKQIGETPGIRHRALLRLTGLSNGRLRILEKTRKVRVDISDGKRGRYYPVDILENESNIVGFIRSNVSRQIVTFILEHEHCTFGEIQEHIKKAPATLSWHLKRLSRAAIISVTYGKQYQLYQVLNTKFVQEILYKYRENFKEQIANGH